MLIHTFSANNSAENPSICRKLKFCKSSGPGINMGRLKFLRWCLFFLKGQCHETYVFFHESSPKPLKITLGHFKFLSKTRGQTDKICHQCRDTGSKFTVSVFDTVANLPPGSLTSGKSPNIYCKFATGINDTGSEFATGVNDTGGK